MPTTVNGIGTHYYGRKNRTARTAPCHFCKRVGALQCYDTRLWFVIVFIPVFPLGRKRIMDECPSCRRHYVADADQYEQNKQLQVSGALDRFRREPSPDAALSVHALLLGFHEREQAAQFRETVRRQFPSDAELMVGLAAHSTISPSSTRRPSSIRRRGNSSPICPRHAWVSRDGRWQKASSIKLAGCSTSWKRQAQASIIHSNRLTSSRGTIRSRAGTRTPSRSPRTFSGSCPGPHNCTLFARLYSGRRRRLGRSESILPPREHSLRSLFAGERAGLPEVAAAFTVIGGAAALAPLRRAFD